MANLLSISLPGDKRLEQRLNKLKPIIIIFDTSLNKNPRNEITDDFDFAKFGATKDVLQPTQLVKISNPVLTPREDN